MIPKRPMLPVAMPQAKKVQWASPNGRATQREHQIYPLIMTNGLPWKITIFNRYCKPSISMGHLYHGYVTNNQRVHLYTYMWTTPYYWKHDFRTHQERKKKTLQCLDKSWEIRSCLSAKLPKANPQCNSVSNPSHGYRICDQCLQN